jgi:hypothetical protein
MAEFFFPNTTAISGQSRIEHTPLNRILSNLSISAQYPIFTEKSSMNLRKITPEDCPNIDAAISKDPWHAGKGSSAFFFDPYTEAFVLSDDDGPVLNVRLSRALRVNIVFNDADARERNKETMAMLAQFLKQQAEQSGVREITYTSENRALRVFGQRLGFKPTPDMVMTVEPKAS